MRTKQLLIQVKMEIESTHENDDDFINVHPLHKSTQVFDCIDAQETHFLSVVSDPRDQ